ncbi:DUF2971 domain-containing protein [Arthrobacter sp. NPDC058097]|uniref:DUF2971 domain-containing protein n=1 Tax=Arthrobacter sp. NPDC058097 TaxID=3346340 RepID=UPI0036DE6893
MSEELPSESSGSNLVWHYTNGVALQNIIIKNELWASNTAFMNDTHERRLADKYLIQARESMRNSFPAMLDNYLDHVGDLYDRTRFRSEEMPDGTRYLLSASNNGDSLTMWRGYAGTDHVSYAIGLDRNEPLRILRPEASKYGHYWSTGVAKVYPWFDVNYDPGAAERRAQRAMQRILEIFRRPSSSPEDLYFRTGDIFNAIQEETEPLRNETKHHGFVHEEEARIIVDASGDLTRYRSGSMGMVPYVALTGGDGSEKTVVEQPNLLPIRRIRMSPGSDRFYALRSLRSLLRANGYGGEYNEDLQIIENEIVVDMSRIPFR